MLHITDQSIVQEYLNKHIPYRINSMLAHDLIMRRKKQNHFTPIKDNCYGDSVVVEPVFEISLIFARSLLNFIGISKQNKNDTLIPFAPKNDDLTIQSLFPGRSFCPLNDQIVIDNYAALCMIIKLANKSVAHLTSEITETLSTDHDILPHARFATYQLVLKYLPETNKQNIWWHTQVDTI
ncbi:MAG: hypothetical protein JSR32_08445 [Proteobacteria bacterium]|nr:hypothetical protein [Pseudomonadota bacterium]